MRTPCSTRVGAAPEATTARLSNGSSTHARGRNRGIRSAVLVKVDSSTSAASGAVSGEHAGRRASQRAPVGHDAVGIDVGVITREVVRGDDCRLDRLPAGPAPGAAVAGVLDQQHADPRGGDGGERFDPMIDQLAVAVGVDDEREWSSRGGGPQQPGLHGVRRPEPVPLGARRQWRRKRRSRRPRVHQRPLQTERRGHHRQRDEEGWPQRRMARDLALRERMQLTTAGQAPVHRPSGSTGAAAASTAATDSRSKVVSPGQ